ncbi:hypothetical protein GCM10010278_84980 [Streptomyces melanogenes]|nr:hypothetical protein GCM10010278_84980 [Streptomyces melanogenes]
MSLRADKESVDILKFAKCRRAKGYASEYEDDIFDIVAEPHVYEVFLKEGPAGPILKAEVTALSDQNCGRRAAIEKHQRGCASCSPPCVEAAARVLSTTRTTAVILTTRQALTCGNPNKKSPPR